jgi:hypothetical protein
MVHSELNAEFGKLTRLFEGSTVILSLANLGL